MDDWKQWTPERLAGLELTALETLSENAARRGASDLEAACTAELAKRRKMAPKTASRRMLGGDPSLRARIVEDATIMGEFAKKLDKEFDLSEATAARRSAGTKLFKPHGLADKQGRAKTGGLEKSKKLKHDRYLSYRLGDSIVVVSAFVRQDEEPAVIRYQIEGPDDFVLDGAPVTESEKGKLWESREIRSKNRFRDFQSLTEALTAYRILVEKLVSRASR
jgi:hypothetical protein